LGLAPASLATSSVSAGALPSPCAAWERLIAFSGPRGPPRTFAQIREVLAAFAPVAGATYALPHGAGCERSPEYSPCAVTDFSSVVQSSDQNIFQSTNQSSHSQEQRSKSVIMPLIELAPHGKDVSLSLTLPEEIATDVKLYARFLKATHQSAVSNIITECIRRTLKQDTEFQTWKSDPVNTKTNRGGARPRKTASPTLSQTK
jgi:hypothetical protein